LQFKTPANYGIICQEVIKLQLMFDAGCSPALYQLQGKSYDFPDMTNELCPQCKADYLKKTWFLRAVSNRPWLRGLKINGHFL
jgi:hypothetical protein